MGDFAIAAAALQGQQLGIDGVDQFRMAGGVDIAQFVLGFADQLDAKLEVTSYFKVTGQTPITMCHPTSRQSTTSAETSAAHAGALPRTDQRFHSPVTISEKS